MGPVVAEVVIWLRGRSQETSVTVDEGLVSWQVAAGCGSELIFIYGLAKRVCIFSFLPRVACCPQGFALSWALRKDETPCFTDFVRRPSRPPHAAASSSVFVGSGGGWF